MTNIIFFGPPGAGKGTQAKIISNKLNLSHLSTGEILRKKILDQDKLAIQLKEIMSLGKLVSDDILNSIISLRLEKEGKTGFILDGYPRSIAQSDYLNNFLETKKIRINYIFNIQINFNLLKERIIKRSSQESRDDDKIDVIETRYKEYINTTEKVSNFYRDSQPSIFYDIDGSKQIDEITEEIEQNIKKSWKSAKILDILSWLHM